MPQPDAPFVSVTVGEIHSDGERALFSSKYNSTSVWTDYEIVSRYESDKHTYMMSVASPDGMPNNRDTVSFVQLGTPTLLWICDWTVSRYGEKPIIPNPTSNDPNWVLLDEHYDPGMVKLGADGTTPRYRFSGTFIYGHRRPNREAILSTSFPRPPWMVPQAADRTMSTTMFERDLSSVESSRNLRTGGGSSGSS